MQMVKKYRNKVGQKIGGIKLYAELKTQMNTSELKWEEINSSPF